MRVDIRSASSEEIERLERMLREAVHESVVAETGAARARNFHGQGLREAIDYIGSRPAAELDANARILQVVRAVDAHLGVNSRVQRASTDANVPISLGREAVAIGAGGTGGGAHTLHEWYDPAGRDLGLKRALLITLTLAGVGE
jgi:di/tripeptidase